MKVLVTGAAGFIGSNLAKRLLDEKYDVTGIDRFSDYYDVDLKKTNIASLDGMKFIEGDLNSIDLKKILPGINVVFHLAAQAGVRGSWGYGFENYINDNVFATQKLLEACKVSSVNRIVFASSSSVYGDIEDFPFKETALLKPSSPYGVTKVSCEDLFRIYARSFGLQSVVLRYFTVYGPRQRPDMAIHKFISGILKNKEITIFGDGEQIRDFTFIDDIVDATFLASKINITGSDIYNIGGGESITVNSLLEILGELTGREIVKEYLDSQNGDVFRTRADLQKSKSILGWAPKVQLKDGLAKQILWHQNLLR